MRIIPSENNGFVLVLFDFAFLDEPPFLCPDAFQQNAGGFVVWVLWDEFALDGVLEYRFFQHVGESRIEFAEFCLGFAIGFDER